MIDQRRGKVSRCTIIYFAFLIASLAISLMGCLNVYPGRDVLFQASTFSAFSDGSYDGDLTYGELRKHGDFGIGTFDGLDGEMLGVDGIFYQIKGNGVAYPVDDAMKTPFAMVTFFGPDQKIVIDSPLDYNGLEDYLDKLLQSKNLIYAIKVEGLFSYVKTRSVPRQNTPYRPLVEVLKDQSIFEFHGVKGTVVGFRLPEYMKEINVQGYHFHFITEDRKSGGHLLECGIENAEVGIDYTHEFHMRISERPRAEAKGKETGEMSR